jgi:hypothetical protein
VYQALLDPGRISVSLTAATKLGQSRTRAILALPDEYIYIHVAVTKAESCSILLL